MEGCWRAGGEVAEDGSGQQRATDNVARCSSPPSSLFTTSFRAHRCSVQSAWGGMERRAGCSEGGEGVEEVKEDAVASSLASLCSASVLCLGDEHLSLSLVSYQRG